MSERVADLIDQLAGITPGSQLDVIRGRRLQAREHAQKSYLALFEPGNHRGVSATERFAVAAFVAGLHAEPATRDFYRSKLRAAAGADFADTVDAEVTRGSTKGPYGSYPSGPLSKEDAAGLIYRVSDGGRRGLGVRLTSALQHTHMLVFHLRDSNPTALQALLNGGWSTDDIVTLSQLTAFLTFQIRTVAGLRALAAAPANVA